MHSKLHRKGVVHHITPVSDRLTNGLCVIIEMDYDSETGPRTIPGNFTCRTLSVYLILKFFFFLLLYYPNGISPMEIRVAFPRESQLRQSHATQPTEHAGCSCVSIIHRTLTWTTRSLTCAQLLNARDCTRGWGVRTP